MPMKHSTYSAIIVGSGIAGLYATIKLVEKFNLPDGVLLLTKSQLAECNSRYAQGGIVGVLPENKLDSVSLHVADTIKAGCGLCDFNVVKFVSENSNKAIKDLIRCGVEFDKNDKNQINFTLEGAHSVRRILHVGGDATGYGIEKALVNKVKNDSQISPNITIYEQTIAVDLLVDLKGKCRGLISFNEVTSEYETVYAPITILATGGTGQVYKYTTNPAVTTGDGLALGIRANAQIKDMEFIQFHPTALSLDNDDSRFLVSESVRGEGAKLLNDKGEYFMSQHQQKDLAPRDVVAREIFKQLSNGNKVYLDATLIDYDKFTKRFPNINNVCIDNDIDVRTDFIPVSPAAHYCMGGIKTNISGKTSLDGLYAIGEVACTSLHGANRLASNSLLECVVSAYELVEQLTQNDLQSSKIIDEKIMCTIKQYSDEELEHYSEIALDVLINKLKTTMWENVGISRSASSLLAAMSQIKKIESEFNSPHKCNSLAEYELRNLIYVSKSIIEAALKRESSIGAHYRSDFKNNSDNNTLKEDAEIGTEVIAQFYN